MVWKLEREKSKRRAHGGKCAGGEMVRNFLAKLHSNYLRVVHQQSKGHCKPNFEFMSKPDVDVLAKY